MSKGNFKILSAFLLLIGLFYGLRSDTIKLSTTYPAPSGVYRKIITTMDTVLARDGGKVVIGGVSSGATKLEVNGQVDMKGNRIAGLAHPPGADKDAATKQYVDERLAALEQSMKQYVDSRTGAAAPSPPPASTGLFYCKCPHYAYSGNKPGMYGCSEPSYFTSNVQGKICCSGSPQPLPKDNNWINSWATWRCEQKS